MDPEELENDESGLNPEGNLFETMANNSSEFDEDEDSDLIEQESDFEAYENAEEDDDEEEDEDDENVFGEEEDEEDEEDDTEFNEKELELFNKKLGTDFKTVDDLKKSFNTQDKENASEKEAAEYKVLENKVNLYDRYIGMNNETLIRNQLTSQAIQEKKDVNDPDVVQEIEDKIEGLNDLGQIDSFADTLRSNLQTQKEKTLSAIEKIDNKRVESENIVAKKNIDDLQNALSDIFVQKEFAGVTISKEDIRDVYEDIRTQKFFDRINGNQEMIAKVAMFLKKEEEIQKLGKRPTHSDNTKTAFEVLAGNSQKTRRSITQANGSASSGNANDNLSSWLK